MRERERGGGGVSNRFSRTINRLVVEVGEKLTCDGRCQAPSDYGLSLGNLSLCKMMLVIIAIFCCVMLIIRCFNGEDRINKTKKRKR